MSCCAACSSSSIRLAESNGREWAMWSACALLYSLVCILTPLEIQGQASCINMLAVTRSQRWLSIGSGGAAAVLAGIKSPYILLHSQVSSCRTVALAASLGQNCARALHDLDLCRVKAGEWLGPWVLCHTLEAVVKKMEPGSLHVHVHVVSQPGGAAPVLYTARLGTVTWYSCSGDCCSICDLCMGIS